MTNEEYKLRHSAIYAEYAIALERYNNSLEELNKVFVEGNIEFKSGDFLRQKETGIIFMIDIVKAFHNGTNDITKLPQIYVFGGEFNFIKQATNKSYTIDPYDFERLSAEDANKEGEFIVAIHKLKRTLRSRTLCGFKYAGWKKTSKTEALIGVSYETAKIHLERKFTKGMNWGNIGEWHIDHIIPLSSAKTEEELKALCHYTNLQPLWAKDNLSKSDKIPQVQRTLPI